MKTRSSAGPKESGAKQNDALRLSDRVPRSGKKRKAPTRREEVIASDAAQSGKKANPPELRDSTAAHVSENASDTSREARELGATQGEEPEVSRTRGPSSVGTYRATSEGESDGGIEESLKQEEVDGVHASVDLGDGVSNGPAKVAPFGTVAPAAPRGKCVSGRAWKSRGQSQKASVQVTTATETLSTTWAKKLEVKAKRKAVVALEKEMRDTKRQEIEDKKQEKLERERRRQRNEMKNTTFQTISKTHKMKAMSKKQLRQIKKRQVNARTGEVEFVSPWGGGKK